MKAKRGEQEFSTTITTILVSTKQKKEKEEKRERDKSGLYFFKVANVYTVNVWIIFASGVVHTYY